MASNEFTYNVLGRTLSFSSAQVVYFTVRRTFANLARRFSANFMSEWQAVIEREDDFQKAVALLAEKYKQGCIQTALNILMGMGYYTFTASQLASKFSFNDNIAALVNALQDELDELDLAADDSVLQDANEKIQAMLDGEVFTDTYEVYTKYNTKYKYRKPTVVQKGAMAINLILLLSKQLQGDTSVNSALREMKHSGTAIYALLDFASEIGGKTKYLLGDISGWDHVGHSQDERTHDEGNCHWTEYHLHVTAAENRERLRKYYAKAMVGKYLLSRGESARIAHRMFMDMIMYAYTPVLECFDALKVNYSGVGGKSEIAAMCENIRSGAVPRQKIPDLCFNILKMNPYCPDGYELSKTYYGDPTGDLARMKYDFATNVFELLINNGSISEFERLLYAAERGDVNAQFNVGRCYFKGQNVPKNAKKAVLWFSKAAEQGYASAQLALGFLYINGQGVNKNASKGIMWFNKAAKNGNVAAQFNLGKCYENGCGVIKDATYAAIWYRKAAEQGHAEAKEALDRLR